MAFEREQRKVLATVKRIGAGQKGFIKTYKSDPMGGGNVPDLNVETYFAQSSMDGRDFSDPSLANGLFKLLIPAIDNSISVIMDFNNLVNNKTATFVYPDGREVNVINVKVSCPDGVTPLLARLYVGA
jgi:hypothetical protein